ncbi:MAG TPA: hypothetical protein VHE14_08595 [Solirubrobacteraceae bacterium]|nr:hypothetical protein [Solirubrobacteraceae bacterium]
MRLRRLLPALALGATLSLGAAGGSQGDVSPPPPTDPAPPAGPTLTLSITRSHFAVAPAATPVAARALEGTTFVYELSTAASVTFLIDRVLPGRTVGGECRVRPGHKILERKPVPKNHCHVYLAVGTLTRSGAAGRNATPFSGRIGDAALSPDLYRVTATATDPASGAMSAPRHALFTVVKREAPVQPGP